MDFFADIEIHRLSHTANQTLTDAFLQKLSQRWELISTPKDGDCLFSSFAYFMWGVITAPAALQMRELLCSYMSSNKEQWIQYIPQEGHNKDEAVEIYLRKMRTQGTFGTYVEIMMAQRYMNVSIVVHSPTEVIPQPLERDITWNIAAHNLHYSPLHEKGSCTQPLHNRLNFPGPPADAHLPM